MVAKILNHHLIDVSLCTSFDKSYVGEFDHVYNSMPIDEYFGFDDGELPYRSLKFHSSTVPVPRLLPAAQINFTHTGPYTRVTVWKLLPGHGNNPFYTTITAEEPCDYRDNNFERYYPVKDAIGHNRKIYHQYAARVPDKMTFIGRCGLYAYLDMHQAISVALSIVSRN